MPPFVPRKRHRSPSPPPSPPAKLKAAAKTEGKRAKSTLFETTDAPARKAKILEDNRKYLARLTDDDEDESSLSEADSDELDFEDVPSAKRRRTSPQARPHGMEEEDDDGDDDEMDWEDAIQHQPSSTGKGGASTVHNAEQEIADVSISMTEDGSYIAPLVSGSTSKKGPSKRERQARVQAHCLHVQALMWHNTVRNSWINDSAVQKTLVENLGEGVRREVTRWRHAMGTLTNEELEAKKKAGAAKSKGRGKRGAKGKENAGRDWSYDAEHLEQGAPNLSAGDPLLRLLKVLAAYWRKRFTVTAPGLRKRGYMPLKRLRDQIKGWEKERGDSEEYGERVESLADLRKLAKKCEGSRDVGAQLFVALLRGLGLEARMVANLQPVGFGWSKAEEAEPKRARSKDGKSKEEGVESDAQGKSILSNLQLKKALTPGQSKKDLKEENPSRKSSRGNKAKPINLEDSDSELSSPPSEGEDAVNAAEDGQDLSIDLDPPTERKRPVKKYDRDLAFPNYWTEVQSPVSSRWLPVDPIVLSTIASNDELLQTFEPRGKRAEKAKQVVCYTVAFSHDGTAKDVTVRYLKKHQLPGKTKGMRMPVEKVPVYNRKGKVKKYEEYDWFRKVMSLYDRPDAKRTAADDLEEQTDLKPWKPAKEEKEVEKESLQWYKQSANFVLEQHLRREEAILPDAQPVRTFTAGKGEKAKSYPVFRRQDVVSCKTVESWHKEGRAIMTGEQAVKYVPMRAVTLIRKREMEDALKAAGEKLQQGLYAEGQTDWIIPPPIQDGVIPKNAYGNMDVYVPTMVPEGAVHLPLKGSAKICRWLEIDYAEACTGFEFGKQRAVPVLTGVVVADEHELLVRDAWKEEQREVKRKEDTKRTGVALHWWRKMVMGLRIVERMKCEYAGTGDEEAEVNPFVNKARREGRSGGHAESCIDPEAESAVGVGGFFAPRHDEEEIPKRNGVKHADQGIDELGGGFLVSDEGLPQDEGGGFLAEDGPDDVQIVAHAPPKGHAPITPVSLQSMLKANDGADEAEESGRSREGLEPVKTKRGRKASAKPTAPKHTQLSGRAKTKPYPNASAVGSDQSDDESVSNLSDVSSDLLNADSDDASEPDILQCGERRSSPQVVVTPQKARTDDARPARSRKKSTPLKSKYFAHAGDYEGDEFEHHDHSESEAEVVKPRKTTARIRARA